MQKTSPNNELHRMTLNRPYKRIARPQSQPNGLYMTYPVNESYLVHHDFAPDRSTAIRGYHAIESDLIRLFEFIEPHDKNLDAFSNRAYEILLRAATEFESNCKSILSAHNYVKRDTNGNPVGPERWNMQDYKRIEAATRLSEYELRLTLWSGSPRNLKPLSPWSTGRKLSWYQDYNTVKHNRVDQFQLANLKNVVDSVAALFAILFAQFNILAFSAHELVSSHDDWNGWLAHHNSAFWVKEPTNWNANECYGFTNVDFATMNPKFDTFTF